MSTPVLCIFARAPVAGEVKSRLAAAIGAAAALEAHCAMVEDTLQRLAGIPGVASELWLDAADHPAAASWATRWRLPVRQQVGADLGQRMHQALCDCLDRGAIGLVVGTDCPDIDAAYVGHAVRALESHDVVLGPAADGGYGLVGVRRPVPAMFRDIAWGSDRVLRQTLTALERAGRTVSRLAQIWDVDTAADWQRYLRRRGPPTRPGKPFE